jgi:hypothetical protein
VRIVFIVLALALLSILFFKCCDVLVPDLVDMTEKFQFAWRRGRLPFNSEDYVQPGLSTRKPRQAIIADDVTMLAY